MPLEPCQIPPRPTRTVYVVGHIVPDGWHVSGVFDDREMAESHCLTTMHFVGPLEVNRAFHDPRGTEWEGAYFPRRGETYHAPDPR